MAIKWAYDRNRGNRHERGYTNKWARYAKSYLKRHPWCVHCEQEGRKTPATELDHIVPHKGDMRLFWRRNNLQPLCKSHHSSKTRRDMTAGDKGHDISGQPLNPGEHWLR